MVASCIICGNYLHQVDIWQVWINEIHCLDSNISKWISVKEFMFYNWYLDPNAIIWEHFD